MANHKQIHFEASAHLQTLLGRELFRSEEYAIVELVKNAYDSGARRVEVFVSPKSSSRVGEIIVADDGSGMTIDQIERLFMVAGYSERPDSDKNGRVPTGEKGVGRFAADRLGKTLDVYTRTKDAPNILRVHIDWTRFTNRTKKFSDITADVTQVSQRPRELAKVGTILQIGQLRGAWKEPQLLTLRRSLEQLFDPFNAPADFSLSLTIDGSSRLSGEITRPALATASIELDFAVLDDQRVRRVWAGSDLQRSRSIESTQLPKSLAGLRGRFLYFVKKPRNAMVGGLTPGVRLYRDGFRTEPFGHPSADWLGIEEKRAKRAGHAHVVPSRLFGFISIQRRAHPELQDTTSREALLDTPATRAMLEFLREELSHLEEKIKTQVSEPRWSESRREKAKESERARLEALSILADGVAHELSQPLQVIRAEADNIGKRLAHLGILDKDLTESRQALDEHVQRIDDNVQFLTSISSGNLDETVTLDLADVVRRECRLFERRCTKAGVVLEFISSPTQTARLNKPTIATVLANLISNGLEALSTANKGNKRRKRIAVSISKDKKSHIIVVRDSGDGIPDALRSRIFKRFVTGKTGGHGLGLSHCKQLVEAQGGTIAFESSSSKGTTFTVALPDGGRAI